MKGKQLTPNNQLRTSVILRRPCLVAVVSCSVLLPDHIYQITHKEKRKSEPFMMRESPIAK